MDNQYAIVVDCRSRDLQVFAASVTEAADRGLVLRKAADLGGLGELSGGEIPQTVILLGGYAAQSSAGFAEVVRPDHFYQRFLTGAAGFGWGTGDGRRGDALRPMTNRRGEKISVTVIVGGCSLTKVGGHRNSNTATAYAAFAGLKLRAQMRGEIIALEGQSDYTTSWPFNPTQPQNGLGGEFPAEHRGDIFAPKPSSESEVPTTNDSPSEIVDGDEFVEVEEVKEV